METPPPPLLLDGAARVYRRLGVTAAAGGLALAVWAAAGGAGGVWLRRAFAWVVFAGLVPHCGLVAACAWHTARLAEEAARGTRASAHRAWRRARLVYRLFAALLLLVGALCLLVIGDRAGGHLPAMAGAALTGGWGIYFLTVMRDSLNILGHAARAEAETGDGVVSSAPSADRSGS